MDDLVPTTFSAHRVQILVEIERLGERAIANSLRVVTLSLGRLRYLIARGGAGGDTSIAPRDATGQSWPHSCSPPLEYI